ncbi:hypothetical protein HNQ80_004246 [Anaerosolibacter carboniphilus]|uniref:Uncharacterized protein n=1 Tax=Anaerosolibacter carboniphilus TaxID=1417629 RepID=A0A841KWN8_9FIRM|nr:hypothetical protein [Anaerosolibacter carboniphilus]MBB6218106.1 hypothetical protein [Anaerosolibacter carboniphilus]
MSKKTKIVVEEIFKSDNEKERIEKLEDLLMNVIKKSPEFEDLFR